MSPPDRYGVLLQIRERAAYLLLLLVTIGRPMSQQELKSITGWGHHMVIDELQRLQAHGLALKGSQRSPWVATLPGMAVIGGNTQLDSELASHSSQLVPRNGELASQRPTRETKGLELASHSSQLERPQVLNVGRVKNVTTKEAGEIPLDNKLNPSFGEGERPQEGASWPPTAVNSADGSEPALQRKQRRMICELMALNGSKAQQLISDEGLIPHFLLAHWYDCQELEKNKKCDDARLLAAARGRRRYTPKPKSLDRAYDWLHLSGNVACPACAEEFVIDYERGEDPLSLFYDCPQCKAEVQPTALEGIERPAGDNRYLSYLDPA